MIEYKLFIYKLYMDIIQERIAEGDYSMAVYAAIELVKVLVDIMLLAKKEEV